MAATYSLVAGEDVEQGGLARARRAEDGGQLAGPEEARHAAEDHFGTCEKAEKSNAY